MSFSGEWRLLFFTIRFAPTLDLPLVWLLLGETGWPRAAGGSGHPSPLPCYVLDVGRHSFHAEVYIVATMALRDLHFTSIERGLLCSNTTETREHTQIAIS